MERIITYTRYAVGDFYTCKAEAIIERRITYTRYAVFNYYLFYHTSEVEPGYVLTINFMILHIPRAVDCQRTRIIKSPGEVVTASAGFFGKYRNRKYGQCDE